MTSGPTLDWNQFLSVEDLIAELTRPHNHREHYIAEVGGTQWGRHHQTWVPSLLVQLEHAAPSGQGDDRSTRGFESRPAARLEALDTLIRIDHESNRWVRRLQPNSERYPRSAAGHVVRLGGLMRQLDRCHRAKPLRKNRETICCTWHKVENDIRRWWAQARIAAGWDTPAWQPHASCPLCGAVGSLRIRFSARVALCVECRETWDPSTINLLGEHIRVEAFTKTDDRRSEPCWCPWPSPIDLRLPLGPAMCPRCASTRCHRAIADALIEHAS